MMRKQYLAQDFYETSFPATIPPNTIAPNQLLEMNLAQKKGKEMITNVHHFIRFFN
jgi:hypothetical protein